MDRQMGKIYRKREDRTLRVDAGSEKAGLLPVMKPGANLLGDGNIPLRLVKFVHALLAPWGQD